MVEPLGESWGEGRRREGETEERREGGREGEERNVISIYCASFVAQKVLPLSCLAAQCSS